MNESDKPQRVAKALCLHLNLDDEATENYLEAARECDEYFESRAPSESKMAAQLVGKSSGHGLLSALLNYGKLLLFGTQVQMPPEVKTSYYFLTLAHIILTMGAYYNQGYNDAISMESPKSFEDFISDLELDDAS